MSPSGARRRRFRFPSCRPDLSRPVGALRRGFLLASLAGLLLLTVLAGTAAAQDTVASFVSTSLIAGEHSQTSDGTVKLTPAQTTEITLGYTVGGTATADSDYTALSGSVTVSAGTTYVDIPVAILDDSDPEGDETVVLTLTAGSGYRVGNQDTFALTILTNDVPTAEFTPRAERPHPDFSKSLYKWVNEEDAGTLNVDLRLSGPMPVDITVKYEVQSGSTATSGSDYSPLSGMVKVPAGATTATIPVTIIDDNDHEGPESIWLWLVHGKGYKLSRVSNVYSVRGMYIRDDEAAVSFVSTSSEVQEDAGTVNLQMAVNLPPDTPFEVGFYLTGTATPGADYRVPNMIRHIGEGRWSGEVTVPANASRVTIPVEIIDDNVEDDGETIHVRLFGGTKNVKYLTAAPDSVTLTIRNDETLPAAHPLVKYAALVKSFHARLTARRLHGDGSSGGWNKRFLKAMGHPDYVDYPQAAVTVADATRIWNHGGPGANTVWDGTVEAVTYAEQYFAGTTTTTPPPASGPEVTIAAGDGVTEGTAATFTLTADPAPSAPLDVSVTVATDGDYGITAGTQTVTIPTTGSATLTLATTGDDGRRRATRRTRRTAR